MTKLMIMPDTYQDASGSWHPAIFNIVEDRKYYWPNITFPNHQDAWERAQLSISWAEQYIGSYVKQWNIYPTL